MLASYHEILAESAPDEPPRGCFYPRLPRIFADGMYLASTNSAKPASAGSSTSTLKEEKKADPVTKRDHLDVAADLMSDIQVETYSSMDKREKTEL